MMKAWNQKVNTTWLGPY